MQTLTLLLLSGGGHTGSNIMASLAQRRDGLRLIATSDVADEPALFGFDAVYLMPRIAADASAFVARFETLLERERPHLVVPCRDEDVQWVAQFAARQTVGSTAFLCGKPELAVIFNDKWASHQFCRQHELPFVASLPCAPEPVDAATVDRFLAAYGLPLVAKPRHGVDSKDITLLTSRDQVVRALRREGYVLQQYLGDPARVAGFKTAIERHGIPLFHTFQGPKRSLQGLIGPDGSIVHIICTQNVMSSRNARTITIDDDPAARAIGKRCMAVFAAAGWRGPLNVQCQPGADGTLLIHEFNARFTGATAARACLGFDEIGAATQAFTGRTMAALASRPTPGRAFEGLAARVAGAAEIATLSRAGEWHAATG